MINNSLQAHRLGLKYPKHVFITYGSYDTQWWTAQTDDSCSAEDRAEVLLYSLAVLHYNIHSSGSSFYDSCYDAMWTLAYAVKNTLSGNIIVSD